MRKLKRPHAPSCLSRYQHGRDNWSHVTPEEREEIWQQLHAMQGNLCAYCETSLITKSGQRDAHIEHFLQKGRDPRVTFDWNNLFGSCNRKESCGKHKDKRQYDPTILIKMDEEDPDHFFLFVSDGTIALREALTEDEIKRAEGTLLIFNLDAEHGALRQMRRNTIQGYIQTAEDLAEYATTFDVEDWLPLFESELEAIKGQPFETAIRHTLMP